ncbi:MAG: hypothetical protein KGJ00_10455, partial [Bradyrhizobium sp.]|nr:hypothetical protein [Bradyrhizobium sp.]
PADPANDDTSVRSTPWGFHANAQLIPMQAFEDGIARLLRSHRTTYERGSACWRSLLAEWRSPVVAADISFGASRPWRNTRSALDAINNKKGALRCALWIFLGSRSGNLAEPVI